MSIAKMHVEIATPDGQMPAFLCASGDRQPAVLLLMEAFGLTSHIQDVATRIAGEGYLVLAPDLYYRNLPDNKFSYEEVDRAMAMMWQLDFGKPLENDIGAALAYLKSRSDVDGDRIGVTGFCLGGGLSFFTACKFSTEIAAAASFYGMVLDEWLDAVNDIEVPVYLFFGGVDPFISSDRVKQVEARFKELDKAYKLKVYPNADHGFFCHERSSYNRPAAEDAWQELTQFFQKYLKEDDSAERRSLF